MGPSKISPWNSGVANQYKATILGSMGYTLVGAATAWPSPTLIKMANHETPMVLDLTQVSWMVSIMFLGHITSPVPSGYLMDKFGRKRTCLWLSVIPLTSWVIIFFASSASHLYMARFAAGLWIGAINTVMPIYFGEIAEPRIRSSLTTINNGLLNLGLLFTYVVGPYVSYKTLAFACGSLSFVFICALLLMPESPHYFLKKEKRKEALECLHWLRRGQPLEAIEHEVNTIEEALQDQKLRKGSVKEIFLDVGNRKAFIISMTYTILKRTSGSGVMRAYLSVTLPPLTMAVLNADSCVIIIGSIGFVSSIACTALSAKFRRRTLLTVSCGVCAICTALIMVWFYLNDYTSTDVSGYSDVIFWSMVVYFSLFNIGPGPVSSSVKGEVFSPNVKALSSSLSTFIVAITSFVLNKYYLIVAEAAGMHVNFLVFTVSCLFTIVFTWTYVPDTHHKTLEEIRAMLKGKGVQNGFK